MLIVSIKNNTYIKSHNIKLNFKSIIDIFNTKTGSSSTMISLFYLNFYCDKLGKKNHFLNIIVLFLSFITLIEKYVMSKFEKINK